MNVNQQISSLHPSLALGVPERKKRNPREAKAEELAAQVLSQENPTPVIHHQFNAW